MTRPHMFTCLSYRDPLRAVEFLTALGFRQLMLVQDDADPGVVHHAEFAWRDGGGVMFGSVRPDDDLGFANRAGLGAVDLVVAADEDVASLFEVAKSHGATVVRGIEHPDFGGCNATIRDFEGNLWCIDSYQGEPSA